MTRNNLEKNIRDKMKDRELQPSANAWDKLEAQLEATPPKRKMVFWYYAAASVVGLMLIGAVVYDQNSEGQPQLVEENVKTNRIDNTIDVLPNTVTDNEFVAVENNSNPIADQKETPQENDVSPTHYVSEMEQETDDIVVETTLAQETVAAEIIEEVESETDFLDQKAQEVALSIKNLKENQGDVTMEEVEALLESARRDIFLNRTIKKSQISAATLLNEVEWELDKTFSDKVFDALGEGFKIIATAYTERNR